MKGNTFLGPINRGPFHPQFRYYENESFKAFEYDVKSIIGPDRYLMIRLLYIHLLYYVGQASDWNPHERLLYGFQVFFEMVTELKNNGLTPFNLEQLEERYPTEEELNELEIDHSRRELRAQKHWAIKK